MAIILRAITILDKRALDVSTYVLLMAVPSYESKFILDSFIFRVSPARFLRRLAANVAFFARSRVSSYRVYMGESLFEI